MSTCESETESGILKIRKANFKEQRQISHWCVMPLLTKALSLPRPHPDGTVRMRTWQSPCNEMGIASVVPPSQ
jgi:hypothetical protein